MISIRLSVGFLLLPYQGLVIRGMWAGEMQGKSNANPQK